MALLLDTNAFLRWVMDDSVLSPRAFAAIENESNITYVSAVTAWELAIKSSVGKLRLDAPVDRYMTTHLHRNGFRWLPIDLSDIAGVETLPPHHRDPFDRLLIAQAQARGLTIVTSDKSFSQYDISVIA